MKGDDDGHHLTDAQSRAVGLGLTITGQLSLWMGHWVKQTVEITDIAADLSHIQARLG